jgi:hypothetical protein
MDIVIMTYDFYVILDHDGYYQILWIMTRDSLSSAPRP